MKNEVAEKYEIYEGACVPNASHFENIQIQNLCSSDFHDREAVAFATRTYSVVLFPI